MKAQFFVLVGLVLLGWVLLIHDARRSASRVLLALALGLGAPAAAQGAWHAHDGWGLRSDKVLHVSAGALAAGPVYAITREATGSPKRAWIAATLAAFAAGYLKERFDGRQGGSQDPADMAYTGAGGFALGFALYRRDTRKPSFATAPAEP